MFTDDVSETWDSSEYQDSFIKDYFGKGKVNLFTDDISETWDSSEYQDSFIKDYFGKGKVSKWEAKGELNSVEHFENCYSIKGSKGAFQGLQSDGEHGEVSFESDLSKTKHTLNGSVKENMKEKRKLSNNFSQQNCIKNNENNIYVNKMEKDTSNIDSNCLKSKRKRKRKSKNRNKGNTEDETTVTSSHEASNQMNGNGEKRRKLSNNSAADNCVKSLENNSEKMELDFLTANSNSVKSKKKRKRKNNKNKVIEEQTSLNSSHYETPKQINYNTDEALIEEEETDIISNHLTQKKSLFQNKLCQKLQAAKFRYLNEMLYTNTGKDALLYFQENAEEFQDYHIGYQSQVSKWPINPVDIIIKNLHQVNKQHIIADLGCGEAKIAEAFPKRTVHSFDLIAVKDCVTACDMANVPLPNKSVDVAVFCLSLMGTNWKDYLKESHRLLKLGGVLKIAEIESRVDNLHDFIKNIEAHGFSLVNKDLSHKMFIFLNFKKAKSKVKTSKISNVILKPCLYKKR